MKIRDEKQIENYLRRQVEKNGGLCLKYECHSRIGYPDRICTLGGGRVVWVEVKAEGEKPRKLQEFRHEELRGCGQWVEVVSTYEGVDKLIDKYYKKYAW